MLASDFIAVYPAEPGCVAPLWLRQFNTMAEAWASCPNPEWMLWVLVKVSPESIRFIRVRTAFEAIVILGEQTAEDTALIAQADQGEVEFLSATVPHLHRAFNAFREVDSTPEGKAALAEFLRNRFNPFTA